MPETGVHKVVDNVSSLLERITSLTRSEVLVGVPEDKGARKEGVVTNAQLAYIHEFGSPARNIPSRPFIRPGIKKAKAQITSIMLKGGREALEGKDENAARMVMEKVGMAARNSVVKEITDPSPPFTPLKPATIRRRLRRTAAGRRQLKKMAVKKADIASVNAKPLIDTGQLRASITYVVREV